ncbi:putative protein kinase putative serine/threonine protein kinase [Leptomonas seymouri]|uniref:Protein kinase domain-containing protein n=1 Tax=Leptomonas seymouri TaxID=5684 RepID=A0A0N0P4I1_LEPSE|nr:putative protein kinase putative serine/threonine protein kinase [Leptomonas seymouri]|eukprot:KPI85326.1 putative protein kinase putative serine/threonine protein kinase [Leptomonas seymouri]
MMSREGNAMPQADACSLKDEMEGASAFIDTFTSVEGVEDHYGSQPLQADWSSNNNNSGRIIRNLYRDTLRIELPYSGSPPCTSPASPAEGTTATTNESLRTAIFRNSDGTAFQREIEACTPTSVAEQHARQSAMAFLNADIFNKARLSQSIGPARSSPPPPAVPPSLSPVMSGSFEAAEVPKKKPPLQPLLDALTRKNRSSLSSSSHAFLGSSGVHAHEVSIPLEIASAGDQESHQHSLAANTSTPRPGSRNSEPQLPLMLNTSRLATSLSSVERLQGAASNSSPPPLAIPVPIPPTPSSTGGATVVPPPAGVTDDDAEASSSSSSGQNIGMEAVLRDASKIRGLRLTWLLYLLIVMVITLFTLLLVQIIYESNLTLVRTATQAVWSQASVLLNSIDMEQYALASVFMLLHKTNIDGLDSSTSAFAIVRQTFCSRFYGAPMVFAMYNEAGDLVWQMHCRTRGLQEIYQMLPKKVMPSVESVRISDFAWDAVLAQRTFYSGDANSSVETFVMLLDMNTFGRMVMGDQYPQYSSSTLQYVTSALLTRTWNGSKPTVLFHTLTNSKREYTATRGGRMRDSLEGVFHAICYTGSPYMWHTVSYYSPHNSSSDGDSVDPSNAYVRWPSTTTNVIPPPNLEYGRAWGQLSVAHFCGVQCNGIAGEKECDVNNPTNIWFVVEYSLVRQNGLASILNVVGVVSICALAIFSFVMFLVYISITVPVNFLRVQLLKAMGATDTQTRFQRKMVGWTYRLWLGDLTAIVRSTHILSLCFQLNKKYVPDHVLRNHAQQLYLRRRKFNFLEDVDLKEDPADHEDTESEGALEPALAQLPSVSAGVPLSENRFLWHFPSQNDGEEALCQFTDIEVAAASTSQGGTSAGAATLRPVAGDGLPLVPSRGPDGGLNSSVYVKGATSTRRVAAGSSDPAIPPRLTAEMNSNAPAGSGGAEQEASLGMSMLYNARNHLSAMAIRRESESTILCVRIPSVELAYLMNYSAAVTQHRRIMRILLHRIRRYKGALFHRSGDCLAAVWNAFEGCPNHAEAAAICAQEIANAFAPLRMDGLHVGLVLHQGVLVCGTIEYSKVAFVTAFGDGPREALAIAELAMTVGFLNIIVTEPVKQCLSGLYDCNIVDVIQLPHSAHPLLLFELGSSRCHHPSAQPTLRAQFAIEYARVFAQFRNHEFNAALQGIEHIRSSMGGSQNEHLLRRLERLCFFYGTTAAVLPYPYTRDFPVWVNYEAIAQAGLKNDAHFHAGPRNNSLSSRSFMDGVVYKGVPTVRNEVECIKDFKQELQENMRRTARKGNGSPTVDESSTRPHITPQSSPPMRPIADLTLTCEERALSVGSGMEMLDNSKSINGVDSSVASPKSRHVDVNDWKTGTTNTTLELSTPAAMNTTLVPPLSHLSNPPLVPLLALDKLHISSATAQAAVAEDASLDGSSMHAASSPRDVLALSSRFNLTQRVTNRPPVALAEVSPELSGLTAERLAGEAETRLSNGGHNGSSSNSSIQTTGMSFKCSVNAGEMDVVAGAGTHASMQSLCISRNNLPSVIDAKSGTRYLRSTRILGKGSFGSVYLGMDAHSGRLVAIKFLPMPSDESGMEDIEAEVLILQRVNDTHVVQLLSYAFEGDLIVIIMECMLAGSLQNMISAFGSIPSSTARVFMRDVMRGLSKIHSMGVIHRDMKPQNVLLSLAGNCKISDFGASAWLQELARKEAQGQVCGTPVYLAPEAARGNPAKESDIWSCGIMFLQMITGVLPYPAELLSAGAAVLVFQIGSGIAQPQIPDDLDELNAEFVRACLQVDPSKRLTAAALLQLPLFTV